MDNQTQLEILIEALEEARSWNNSDVRTIDEISPNMDMLLARRRVINKALRAIKGKA